MRRLAATMIMVPIMMTGAVSACASSPEPPSEPPLESSTVGGVVATTEAAVTPDTADDSAIGGPLVQPAGFETSQAVVTAADGSICEICVWLADTVDQRSRGLITVTDLGVGDAMAFRYPEPHTGTFWMKNTVIALSIAFFAPEGEFMTSFDMEPCTTETCPTYATADGFLIALEVPQGGLTDLGIGPGSTLDVLDLPCE